MLRYTRWGAFRTQYRARETLQVQTDLLQVDCRCMPRPTWIHPREPPSFEASQVRRMALPAPNVRTGKRVLTCFASGAITDQKVLSARTG